MPDDEKPNAVDDLKKGLGLLFRAAKTAVDKLALPDGSKLEDVVMSGAREVGRAVENVADTIDRELFHKPPPPQASTDPTADGPHDPPSGQGDKAAPGAEEPKGPRVG